MAVVAMLQGTEDVDRDTTQAALAIAKRMKVSLSGLCALPDPQSAVMVVAPPESAGLIATTADDVYKMQEDVRQAAEKAFSEATAGVSSDVAVKLINEVETVERAAANAATLAEAVVFPRSATKSGEPLNLAFDHVLMQSRLPCVVAGTSELKDGPVIIAWDGSNVAARAVRFHLPLIRAFGDVIIAQNADDLKNDPDRPIASPDSLHAWLNRHGVTSKSMAIEGEVASGLLAMAKGAGASMIVAGAYGHSRLAEQIFGGTSKRLLAAEEAPAFAISH